MFSEVRKRMLEEAIRSPELLSDLAGLESYIAESYDSRALIELLQNADDALAKRFKVVRSDGMLFVANDGRPFSSSDFESLCRSAASRKKRDVNIGYRGIGFKSVVNIAQKFHIISGELSATFSRERTRDDVPNARRVPLVRIPHAVIDSEYQAFQGVLSSLLSSGYTTVFIFSEIIADALEVEYASFDWTSLLFLRSLNEVSLGGPKLQEGAVVREKKSDGVFEIDLTANGATSRWRVWSRGGISLGFALDDHGVCRLEVGDAVVHAHLPTRDRTGLGIKINGDLSTDPSRTRVVWDERTAQCAQAAAEFILLLIGKCIEKPLSQDSVRLLTALAPIVDPRVVQFQKPSFEKGLIESMMLKGCALFDDLLLRPNWLRSTKDFEKIARASKKRILSEVFEDISGLVPLLKALGAREARMDDLAAGLFTTTMSSNSASDILEWLARCFDTKQIAISDFNKLWSIWPVGGRCVNMEELCGLELPLDESSLSGLQERMGSLASLRRLVSALTCDSTASKLVPANIDGVKSEYGSAESLGKKIIKEEKGEKLLDDIFRSPKYGNNLTSSSRDRIAPRITLKKWRNAEQQVCDYITARGWKVRDVSLQNLGYDIEATSDDGLVIFVEVKKIGMGGDEFIITNNEMSLAREQTEKYFLALVRDSGKDIEISFIKDPANSLQFQRQCRQWAWVCHSYPFDPDVVHLE